MTEDNGHYPHDPDLDRITELNALALKLNSMGDLALLEAKRTTWRMSKQDWRNVGRAEAFSDAVDQVHKLAFKWLAEAKEARGLDQ